MEPSARQQNIDAISALWATVPAVTDEISESLLIEHHHACFFTGHRNIPIEVQTRLQALLAHEIESLVYQGFSVFYCGGARGFDLMAAAAVLHLQRSHPALRLILILPCLQQTRGWNDRDLALYRAVLERGEAYLLQKHYDRQCMLHRNRFLVDHAAVGVAYYDDTNKNSGTGMTVRYAQSQGLPLINLLSIDEHCIETEALS